MFMTEQGAGSDIAATATRAVPRRRRHWRLHGDKWFCSNPDAGLRDGAGARPTARRRA